MHVIPITHFDLSAIPIGNKRQILRNCVEPETGLHVFEEMKNKMRALQTEEAGKHLTTAVILNIPYLNIL
jgi:hypothetical protein